jgi:hypothetical protein
VIEFRDFEFTAAPPNKALQLTCRFVTPLAGARGAPNRHAAEL